MSGERKPLVTPEWLEAKSASRLNSSERVLVEEVIMVYERRLSDLLDACDAVKEHNLTNFDEAEPEENEAHRNAWDRFNVILNSFKP